MKGFRSLLAIGLIGCLAVSLAQVTSTPKGPKHHGTPVAPRSQNARMTDFAKRLALTKDQQAKINKVMTEHYQRLQTLAKNQKVSDADRKAKILAERKLVNVQIRKILTEKQRKTFDQMIAEAEKTNSANKKPTSKP